MPDTDVDKPDKTPPSKAGAGGRVASGGSSDPPMTLEEELDKLLADIELAVDDLDPLGDLEKAAAKARQDADAGDPEYDETEDLFEVITPAGTEATDEVDDAQATEADAVAAAVADAPVESEAVAEPPSALDAELDSLIEDAPASGPGQMPVSDAGTARPEDKKREAVSVEHTQIDHELDALLAEAGSLLDDQTKSKNVVEVSTPQKAAEVADQTAEAETEDSTPAALESTEEPTEAELPIEAPESAAVDVAADTDDAVAETADAIEDVEIEAPAEADLSHPAADEVVEPAPASDVVEDAADSAPEAIEEASEQSRSIEEVDAALAAKADEVAASESETEDAAEVEVAQVEDAQPADDAFRTSEEVVEAVIDAHASAVQDETESPDDADDLAHLMAESPASADLGVAESAAAEAPAPAPPESGAASPAAAPQPAQAEAPAVAAEPKKQKSKDAGPGRLTTLWLRVRPAALRVARVVSKPLEMLPPRVRDDIGWLALVTMFLALAVLTALLLFR